MHRVTAVTFRWQPAPGHKTEYANHHWFAYSEIHYQTFGYEGGMSSYFTRNPMICAEPEDIDGTWNPNLLMEEAITDLNTNVSGLWVEPKNSYPFYRLRNLMGDYANNMLYKYLGERTHLHDKEWVTHQPTLGKVKRFEFPEDLTLLYDLNPAAWIWRYPGLKRLPFFSIKQEEKGARRKEFRQYVNQLHKDNP